MKFAISNIAWCAEEDRRVAELLPRLGIQGVEIAPTRVWADPLRSTSAQVSEQRRFWENHGLPIVALQSLLFGHPEFTIFGTDEAREKTWRHLSGMISLGRDLGARVLVFGSPKNRKTLGRPAADVQAIAVNFFRELGNRALQAGVSFCIEPNPPYYDCDFVTTSSAGLDLVKAVDTPGFGLHLDAAGMTLAQEDPDMALSAAAGQIQHFHVSEKDLAPLGSGSVEHARFAAALRKINYANWVSVEMRPKVVDLHNADRATQEAAAKENVRQIQKSLDLLQALYGE